MAILIWCVVVLEHLAQVRRQGLFMNGYDPVICSVEVISAKLLDYR